MAVDRRTWLKLATVGAGASVAGSAAASPQAHSSASPSPVVTVVAKGDSKTDYSGALAKLSAYIALHLKDYGLPGMTFCMADKDGFTAIINAGWADVDKRLPLGPDHLFQIGSISKSFAALCVLKAAADGKLTLDDAMADHLPGVPLPAEKITVRQVLTHATGLPDDAPFFPRGGDQKLWLGYAPGSRFSYSNTGYALLGLMLERLHGKPYAEIVRTEALEPLGMTGAKGSIRTQDMPQYAVGYWPYLQDRPFPQRGELGVAYFTDFTEASGCVAAPGVEMAHYIRYLIGAGSGRGAPLLSDADAKAFTTPVIDAPVFGPKAHYSFGLGIVPVNGRQLLHHTGGMMAFSSSIHVDPEAGVGAFASTNARIGSYRPRDVTAYACELMLAARQGSTAPAPPKIHYDDRIETAADYAGRYETAVGEAIVLAAEGDRLSLTYPRDGRTVALRAQGDDAFLVPHPRFERALLVFKREGGKPVSAWWNNALFSKDPAKRTPPPTPPDLAVLAGLYVNNDPWADSFQVVARPDGLWIDGVEPLIALPDGSYRVGQEAWGCERVWFEAPLDGRPQRMIFSGVDHLRMADET
jgi:CubicO group peptidase (beta-lactamase class C family)